MAASGVESLCPEMVEQVSRLSRERQPLLVQREEIRQQLRALETGHFDAARLQLAFERLCRVLVATPRPELRALLFNLIERIDVCEIERSNRFKLLLPGDRLFRLSFLIRIDQVIAAMECGTVIDLTTTSTTRRGRTMEMEAEVLAGRHGRAKIVDPFRIDLDGLTRTVEPLNEAPRHHIYRATRWNKENICGTGVREIARKEGVSPSLVSLHLKLPRLDPEIQGFLRDLTSQKALQHFSLRKLAALAELPHERQLVEFAVLRSRFN
ncbi:MAG: hypothetical protein C0502_03440 [Opitutus sp.]|nr:hypothetical protein [Opitutus sp.]